MLTVIPGSVKYPIPYACQLPSFNAGISCCVPLSLISLSPCVPVLSASVSHLLSIPQMGIYSPFYLGCFLIEPWDSLSGHVHPGIACLASQASDWEGAFWGRLSGLWLATFCYVSIQA